MRITIEQLAALDACIEKAIEILGGN